MIEHDWSECEPAILSFGVAPSSAAAMDREVRRVFAELSDADRKRFHALTCLNDQSLDNLAVMQRISDVVRARMTN